MGMKSETDYGFKLLNRNLNLYKLCFQKEKIPTFGIDNLLPSLPLPELDQTLNKYLDSVRPLVDELEYLQTQRIVEKFRSGIGKNLHFHLKTKSLKEKNWVT
jgi:hypothetical protein